MFLPPPASVSVLDAPYQITVEFTDYASYQHHQQRQQQYREAYERQQQQLAEQQQQQEQEEERQRQRQQGAQGQQRQFLQQQYPPENPYPNQFTQLSQHLPQQLPTDQQILIYQQQQLPPQAQHPPAISADPRPVDSAKSGRNGNAALYDGRSGLPQNAGALSGTSEALAEALAVPDLRNGGGGGNGSGNGSGESAFVEVVDSSSSGQRQPLIFESATTTTTATTTPPSAASFPNFVYGCPDTSAAAVAIKQTHLQQKLLIPSPQQQPQPHQQHPQHPQPFSVAAAPSVPGTITPSPSGTPALASPPAVASAAVGQTSSSSPTFFPPPPPPTPTTAISTSTSPSSSFPMSPRQLRRQQHHSHSNNHHNHHSQHGQHSHHNHHQHLQHVIQRRRIKSQASPPSATVPNHDYPLHTTCPSSHPLAVMVDEQRTVGGAPIQTAQDGQLEAPPASAAQSQGDTYQQMVAAEIAAQEAAARDYKPDLTGPAISELRPTEDIKKMYATGDYVFVQKTATLPQRFPLYRAVRGDGNCGWRAIGFCYFEALIYAGDIEQIAKERSRLQELNAYIRDVGGYDPYVYEDMVEETDILFGTILDALPDADKAIQVLTDSFNDDGSSNAIIYHLRLLTASYLKGNVESYEGFVAHEAGVIGYCQEWIERPNCEIDHLRVEILGSVLLKPIDIVLEIAYLDRSEGHDAPVYNFPGTNIGREEHTIGMRMSLLFRPDHYDILYRPSHPSRAVAEAALRRFYPANDVSAALELNPDLAAAILQTAPAAPSEAVPLIPRVPNIQADPEGTAEFIRNYDAATRYFERMMPSPAPPSIPENTPDLTPASSTASPAPIPTKEEPMTPTLAPATPVASSARPVTREARTTGTVVEAVANDATNSAVSTMGSATGRPATHTPAVSAALAENPALSTMTSAGPSGISPTGPSAVTSTAPKPEVGPASASGSHPAPPSNDVHVNRVTSISYNSAAQATPSLGTFSTANFGALSFLPTMFGSSFMSQSPTFPPGSSSSLCGPMAPQYAQSPRSPWSDSTRSNFMEGMSSFAMASSLSSSMAPVRMTEAQPAAVPMTPTAMPGTPMTVMSVGSQGDRFAEPFLEPTYGAAEATSAAAMMDVPSAVTSSTPSTPVSQQPPQQPSQTTGSTFLPGPPESHPVRFTKWQFERPNQAHEAAQDMSLLRNNSRFSVAHFSNPEFQPEEYRPGDDNSPPSKGPSTGGRGRKKNSYRDSGERHT